MGEIKVGTLFYLKDECECILTRTSMEWRSKLEPDKEGLINLVNAYGVDYMEFIKPHKVPKLVPGFVVRALKWKNQDITERAPVDVAFTTTTKEEAEEWIEEIFKVIRYNADWAESETRKPVYIIINPMAGNQEALKVYQQIVIPMLASARLKHQMIITERVGHAREIAAELDIDEWSTIATISGNGTINEVFNGLVVRSDWQKATLMPLAVIPAPGTGNGLMKSFNIGDARTGVFNIIKGHVETIDVFGVTQDNSDDVVRYGLMALFWGFFADTLQDTEKYRWAGSARFAVGGLMRLLGLPSYKGVLSYSEFLDDENDPGPEVQVTVEENFVVFCATNVAWIGRDILIAPKANPFDGFLDLVWVTNGVSKSDLIKMFYKMAVDEVPQKQPGVKMQQVASFTLEPIDSGILVVDGEQIPSKTSTVHMYPGLAKIITPKLRRN